MSIESRKLESTSVERMLQYQPQIAAFEILAQARARAVGRGYAGDVSPQHAWMLCSSGVADLIDVRTKRELERVGFVPGAKYVEWLRNADMLHNPRFIHQLKGKVAKDDILLFLCRSSKRSVAAAQAATEAGYRNALNVLEGFEGGGNSQQGWINRGLPSAHNFK